MNEALLWIPTLDLSSVPAPYHEASAKMFLAAHHGRGHIISPDPLVIRVPSLALTSPRPGFACHLISQSPIPDGPLELIDVTISCPRGVQDPHLARLDQIFKKGPVRRVILTRQGPEQTLNVIAQALETLLDTFPEILIAIDVNSFGWDAVSHFAAEYPPILLDGIADSELWRLMDLAQVLQRPVWLDDFSHHPKPVPELPQYKIFDPPPVDVHRIPFSSRFR